MATRKPAKAKPDAVLYVSERGPITIEDCAKCGGLTVHASESCAVCARGRLRKQTHSADPVPKLMGANIKDFDIDSQFDITNQRMLAVRDDLTQFINASFGRLASATVAQIDGTLKTLIHQMADNHNKSVLPEFWKLRDANRSLNEKVDSLMVELVDLRIQAQRRWWKTAWRWLNNNVVIRKLKDIQFGGY